LPVRGVAGRIRIVSAEQLIALEAAVAELGNLYTVARTFAALQVRAEAELLPQVEKLGGRLRRLVRREALSQAEIDKASAEVLTLRARWRTALDDVRHSAEYEQALAAYAADRQLQLVQLIPLVFASLRLIAPPAALYFPVSASSRRRRPGSSPFLSPADCAERIAAMQAGGLVPEAGEGPWWECEMPFLACGDSPSALETPIAVRVAREDMRAALFAEGGDLVYRIYTPRLQVPLTAVLATEASDEWWEAYDDSYETFRRLLREELHRRQVPVAEGAQ
jgi:hypothetical protein